MQNSKPGGLGEKFEGFGATPSEALWGNIAGALDEKKSKKGFIWWWIGSGLAAVLLVTAVIYNSSNPIENQTAIDSTEIDGPTNYDFRTISHNNIQTNKLASFGSNDENISEDVENNLENAPQATNQNSDLAQQKNNNEKVDQLKPIDTKDAQKTVVTNNDEFAHLIPFSPRSKVSLMNKIPLTSMFGINPKLNHPNLISCGDPGGFFDKPWEIGFRVGYYADLNPQVQAEYTPNSFNTLDDQNGPPEIIEGSEIGIAESINNTSPTSITGSASKNINIDFTLGKYISPRFTIQSGINFTRSTYQTDYQSFEKMSAKTNISSFALPIGFGYDLFKRKRYKLRLTAAIDNEFSLYENQNSIYFIGPPESSNGFTKGYSASTDFSIQSQIRLQKGMYLTLSPTYRRYLIQNVNSENLLVQKNNWLGGTIGMIWTL
ncbi:MAG: hypothetical protein BM555_05400 [Crocinitomix sp. MedPE-SWsnd]|nr:MAG: hypothetical protein BM555_05400 [Crocinitomix sp. MedPE-SWsnd]